MWNLLSGYSGLISFGHAVLFGLGGYTVTIAFVSSASPPGSGSRSGIVVGVLAGVVIGLPTFRLRGHYFALSMLAYPLAMLYVFEWLGYQEVPLPMMRVDPCALRPVRRWPHLYDDGAGADRLGGLHGRLAARRVLALRLSLPPRHQAE